MKNIFNRKKNIKLYRFESGIYFVEGGQKANTSITVGLTSMRQADKILKRGFLSNDVNGHARGIVPIAYERVEE